jgi:hypothetical protein
MCNTFQPTSVASLFLFDMPILYSSCDSSMIPRMLFDVLIGLLFSVSIFNGLEQTSSRTSIDTMKKYEQQIEYISITVSIDFRKGVEKTTIIEI